MTSLQGNTPNPELHGRLTALRHQKAIVEARFDEVDAERAAAYRADQPISDELATRYDQADKDYDAAIDAYLDGENAVMDAPILSEADVLAKLRILISRADTWGACDVSRLAKGFVDQVMAFAERHVPGN